MVLQQYDKVVPETVQEEQGEQVEFVRMKSAGDKRRGNNQETENHQEREEDGLETMVRGRCGARRGLRYLSQTFFTLMRRKDWGEEK